MKNKLCFIVSDVNESHQLNALFNGIKQVGYDVSLIFIGAAYPKIAQIFAAKNFTVKFIECRGKKDFPKTLLKIYSLLGEIKPEIVHTHLQTASLLGLTAAKMRGIKKRIHTRHHATEQHDYHPHAVYYDKYCNRLSAQIIAISRNVKKILIERENVDPKKISVVHHGFQLKDFKAEPATVSALKTKYNLHDSYPIVGVISRFTEGKGIQFVIPAFAKVLEQHSTAKLVLANAKGSYSGKINELLAKYLKPENYVLIDFESSIFELYKTFDTFVHVPINRQYEAFGQTYVEALALEVPSVFTLSGIAPEFIVNEKNALVVDFCDATAVTEAIEKIINNKQLSENITRQGKADVENLFSISKMVNSLTKIYLTKSA